MSAHHILDESVRMRLLADHIAAGKEEVDKECVRKIDTFIHSHSKLFPFTSEGTDETTKLRYAYLVRCKKLFTEREDLQLAEEVAAMMPRNKGIRDGFDPRKVFQQSGTLKSDGVPAIRDLIAGRNDHNV